MGKRSKVLLPGWIRWFIIPLLVGIWALITYLVFGPTGGDNDLGVVGWLGITLFMTVIGTIIWLMAAGKLPAYIIEEDEDDA